MVYRAWLGTALLIAGCAPRVILSDEGASGTSEGTDTAASSDGESDGSSPVTTQPPMTTIGPMSTSGPTTDTFGSSGVFGSSGFFGSSSGDFPAALCWSATPLFEAPEESRLFVVDQDGDGLAELWLSFFEGGGGPRGGAEMFWFDTGGQPIPAGFFPGFLTGLHDMNGDGLGDSVGFSFGGGPPALGYIVSAAPFEIGGPFTPTPFGFEDGFEGFAEVTGDGLADFFRNSDGAIELLAGDGLGGFNPIAATLTGLTGDIAPRSVKQDPELVALAQSGYFDDLDGCSPHGFELFRNVEEGLEPVGVGGQSDGFSPTQLIGAESFGAFTNVYARACSAQGDVTVQVHRFEGTALATVDEYAPSSFAAFGDFDGNGHDDIGLGGPTLDTIRVYNGSAAGTFTEAVFDEVLFGEPVPSRVFIVDIDADGRDEIILGTRDGGAELEYQRLELEPC